MVQSTAQLYQWSSYYLVLYSLEYLCNCVENERCNENMVSQCHSQWDQVLSLDLFGDVWSFYKSQGIPISIRFRLNSVWLEFHVK